MSVYETTIQAIEKALESPKLSEQGLCEYVTCEGNHCIVGQVLSDYGVSDDDLLAENDDIISTAANLFYRAVELGLSITVLSAAQSMFDNGDFDITMLKNLDRLRK